MKVKTPSPGRQFRDVPDPMVPGALLTQESTKWEYKTVVMSDTPDLNSFGSEGWELVGIKERPADQAVFYFRRPKQS